MTHRPLLSVIIPLYNCEKFLAQCLDSILAQQLDAADFEIIIMDDGSSDNGPAIAARYAGQHGNIRIHRQENQGVATARNNALTFAGGEYVTFVDADDMLASGSMKALLQTACEHKAEVVKAAYIEVTEDATAEGCHAEDRGEPFIRTMSGSNAIVNVTRFREGFCWGYLIKRSLIADNDIRFPAKVSFMEDWAFINQILLKCRTFVHTDRLMYLYRRNSSSCVANMTVEKILLACHAIEIVAKMAGNTGGEVRKKLTYDVCTNINILLWYTIHYKQIYLQRKPVIKALCGLLSLSALRHIPSALLVFRLFPDTFIRVRHLMASRIY
ncbi:MAG: glycosyltransferase family 2 protein [Prevotella sp.]